MVLFSLDSPRSN